MKKKLQKLMAVVLSVSMSLSLLSIGAAATELPEGVDPIQSSDILPDGTPNGDVTAGDPVAGTDENGNPTSTQGTEWSEGGDDAEVKTEGSETEVSTRNPDGSTTVQTEGKETTTQNQSDTVTTETPGQIVIDETVTNSDTTGSDIDASEQEGDWTKVEGSDNSNPGDGEWQEGDVVWQDPTSETITPSDPQSEDIDLGGKDPLNGDGSITIEMKPGEDAEPVTVLVSLEELVNENIDINTKYPATGPEGVKEDVIENGVKVGTKTTVVTHVPQYNESGKLIGYEVITTVTVEKVTGESDPVAGDPQYGESYGLDGTGTEKIALPDGVEAGTKDVTDADGNPIGKVETVIEEVIIDGQTYYKVTKITTTDVQKVETPEPDETFEDVVAPEETQTIRAERPADIEPYVNDRGNTVTVEVKEINGGYERVYVETDANGNQVGTRTERFYDTTVKINTTTSTDATGKTVTTDTNTVTTETMLYSATEEFRDVTIESTKDVSMEKTVETTTQSQIIQIDGKEFVFTGTMGDVQVNQNDVIVNDESAGLGLAAIPLDEAYWDETGSDKTHRLQPKTHVDRTATNDLRNHGTESTNSSWYIPYSLEELRTLQSNLDEGEYVLVGYGAFSEYILFDDQETPKNDIRPKGSHALRQFAILGPDGITYGYCAELREGIAYSDGTTSSYIPSTDITTNRNGEKPYVYDQLSIEEMIGKEITIPLKDGEKSLAPLNSIVSNGYMGTTSGVGSLDAVKDLMRRNGVSESVINSLTEGQALAATQAAIWKYGNDGNYSFNDLNDYIIHVHGDTGSGSAAEDKNRNEYNVATGSGYKYLAEDYANIEALFNVLCNLADASKGTVAPKEVEASDVKGATIVLKEEVPVEKYNSVSEAVKAAKKDSDKVYNTDLSFTLAISNSTYNGDLVVYVYAGDQLVETRRIAGDGEGDLIDKAERQTDGNTTYTISDIQLAENVNITLRLAGTQYLAEGVYVYACENSQNFVGGVNSMKQDFDFEVDLSFSVTDPSASIVEDTTKTKDTYEGSRQDTMTETYQQVKYDQHAKGETETTVTESVRTVVEATITVVETVEQETSAEVEWTETTVIPAEDPGDDDDDDDDDDDIVTGDDDDDGDDDIEIGDDDVPLTDIPDEDVPLVDLPDEDVPLIDMIDEEVPLVPMTGDKSRIDLWAMMSLFSGFSLLGLAFFGRKREELDA